MKKTITFFPTRVAMMLVTLILALTAQTARADDYYYIDDEGSPKLMDYTISYTLIESGGETTLSGEWYVVDGIVNITGKITLTRNVNIVLCDGAKLNIGTADSRIEGCGIKGYKLNQSFSLTIYGQEKQSGTLSVYCASNVNNNEDNAIVVKDFMQHGGKVIIDNNEGGLSVDQFTLTRGTLNATTSSTRYDAIDAYIATVSGGSLTATSSGYAISTTDGITISGGNVIATGGYTGVCGDVTLSLTKSTDSFMASSYEGSVTIAAGTLYDETGASYTGNLDETQIEAIEGKTLMPVYSSGNCGTDGHEDEVTWRYDPMTMTLTISGTGAMGDDCHPWSDNFKTVITSVVIDDGVTSIGRNAFKDHTALKDATIGNGVKSIGLYAFKETGLTSIIIPASVTSIDMMVFENCNSLATVTFASESQLTSIEYMAFCQCRSLTSINIPASVTSINMSAFSYSGLMSINIPASVTSIGSYAFYSCGNLATVTFASGSQLTSIGGSAFQSSGLTSISIPASVTSIGMGAFSCCNNLTTVTLNSNPTIGEDAFEYIKDGATVKMNLTANEGKTGEYWMTFYNENYSFTADTNTKIYKAAVNSDKTAVLLTEVGDIPANNAAVLKSSNAAITMTLASSTSGDYTDNELLGADEDMNAPANAYCLSKETTRNDDLTPRGVGFYTYTGTIPANRAYLVVTGGPTTSRGFLGFGDDDGATAIDNGKLIIDNSDGTIYDLSGRIVKGLPHKGIYVKNGKKVVIK